MSDEARTSRIDTGEQGTDPTTPPGELSDAELEQATGAGTRKAGGKQQEYYEVKMTDILISS